MRLGPRTVLRLISYWPPYFAAGITVVEAAADLTSVRVSLKVRPWNRNYFGTHFGGSLYAMCDPFYVFMLVHLLGPGHIVWEKAAEIEFRKAVSEPVFATFTVSRERADGIAREALDSFSVQPRFSTEITTAAGMVVARVEKTLYVRRKDAGQRFPRDIAGSG